MWSLTFSLIMKDKIELAGIELIAYFVPSEGSLCLFARFTACQWAWSAGLAGLRFFFFFFGLQRSNTRVGS